MVPTNILIFLISESKKTLLDYDLKDRTRSYLVRLRALGQNQRLI